MPNFIAKSICDKPYPFGKDDVEFLWEVSGRKEKLIYSKSMDQSFFIISKLNEKNSYTIKGEKITRPSRVGLLQKALSVYKDENTKDVVSEAMAFKKTRLLEKPEYIVGINEFLEEFEKLKYNFKQIFIEIGFGSGRHLLYQARNNPNTLIIGIEIYKPSIEQVTKLAKSENLHNVKLVDTDARLLLSLIDSNLIDKIFLHFPVPWDKAEHRRVVSYEFAKECERTLKIGGNFELRTDSKEYFDFSLSLFLALENSQINIKKNQDLSVSSKYEDRWKKMEKDIYDMSYTCIKNSEEIKKESDFSFKNRYDLSKIALNFNNHTIKEEDYFLHFEELYKSDERLIIKLALGAFNKPERCYIKLENETCEYFIKQPLFTRENLKAHKILEDFLNQCKI
ncbi:tRNA m7G46 methyltransferase [Campylobacter pinnipediorum subsp. caledonicus]|uniref:tRNA (guanine-N(7)-)-methyltransferase n=1 Tax=Campylobacter pinnipediorum subsp. caledonicus TaxID=1874362 RepID=A0A1S6U987_9BACT|nr:tRNA (guanosine(46)-N7)-methyltransferase TrmB [Campylobacter pinnipediorum]AQW86581.1 tRNA m7G46 methyltransferase [Campylobacter pinnipediorum subsp. caledonicus]AQW88232.1 tRNA m7G46 methyltransferase [Campylobacter pinnipediorum subsp. caledonicus]OPA70626.1 tRNA (guanosine(46)-N7)-methyltransferase TrmB [Campylobacter pinnipediorum subsp. caledonicus]